MKRLFLSLSLLGSAAMHANKLQDFLMQSGAAASYEQLTEKQKKMFNECWSKIEGICSESKEAFTQLAQENQEGMEILKQLLGKETVNLSISLMGENKQ